MKHIKMFLLLVSTYTQAVEYVYPILQLDKQSVFYVHQKSLADLELWQYTIKTKIKHKKLFWRFVPAGLKLLCDKSGFSFIDSGRLRIKKFSRRSPRSIEFDQPVSGISDINWLSNDTCYFSAKQGKYFNIFYGNITNSTLACIHQLDNAECLCPNIVEDELFYIERNVQDRACCLAKITTPKINKPKLQVAEVIIDCSYQQIIYLKMISSSLGFYVEHMPYINDNSETINFVCYKVEQKLNHWVSEKLFNFRVFKKYLFGNDRLHESFLPFLPRAQKKALYFADIKQISPGEYISSIIRCSLIDGKIESMLDGKKKSLLFAPLVVKNKLFYGQVINSFNTNEQIINNINIIDVN